MYNTLSMNGCIKIFNTPKPLDLALYCNFPKLQVFTMTCIRLLTTTRINKGKSFTKNRGSTKVNSFYYQNTCELKTFFGIGHFECRTVWRKSAKPSQLPVLSRTLSFSKVPGACYLELLLNNSTLIITVHQVVTVNAASYRNGHTHKNLVTVVDNSCWITTVSCTSRRTRSALFSYPKRNRVHRCGLNDCDINNITIIRLKRSHALTRCIHRAQVYPRIAVDPVVHVCQLWCHLCLAVDVNCSSG
jgi:hypothetical protein